MKKILLVSFAAAVIAAASSLSVRAEEGAPPPPPPNGLNGHPHPPKEALEACAKKKSGDPCSFTGMKKEKVEGTCFSPEKSKPLACRPDHAPGMDP